MVSLCDISDVQCHELDGWLKMAAAAEPRKNTLLEKKNVAYGKVLIS